MAADTDTETRLHASVTRKLVRNPLVWGTLLLLAAIAFTLAGDDLSFFPFLLMLVGGWCFGFAFVNATFGMVPARNGVILHTGVAVVLGALLAFVVEFGETCSSLPPMPCAESSWSFSSPRSPPSGGSGSDSSDA